jgi:hypothetical protein
MPVIAFMSARSPEDSTHLVEEFRRGLGEGGFVEGRNVAMEFRWARGDYSRLPALAADLVSRQVAVIVAAGASLLDSQRKRRPRLSRSCLESAATRLHSAWSRVSAVPAAMRPG